MTYFIELPLTKLRAAYIQIENITHWVTANTNTSTEIYFVNGQCLTVQASTEEILKAMSNHINPLWGEQEDDN